MTYELREFGVDDISELIWIKEDTGAWDGPKDDWVTSHKEKYTKYCKQFRTCIAAGGNQGMYPRLLSQLFQRVMTFEPDHRNFHCLVNNCQSENIIKINAALGSSHLFVDLNRPVTDNTGMHNINLSQPGFIPQLMIDDFDFTDLDFIQLDIEGYEINALQGAYATIQRNLPLISCENGNDVILQYLSEFGYSIVDQSKADTLYAVVST